MKKIATSTLVLSCILIIHLSCTKKQEEKIYVSDCYSIQENLHKGTKVVVPSSIQNLYDFIYQYRSTDPAKASAFIDELLVQSEKINFQHGIAKAHYSKAWLYLEHKKEYSLALENYQKALTLYESIGAQEGVAESYTAIGTVYYLTEFYDAALVSYTKALNWWKILGNKKQEANTYRGIGLVYQSNKNYQLSIENFVTALKIKEELKDQQEIVNISNDLGVIYMYKNQFDQAINYYNQSIQIAEQKGYKRELADVYNNIAAVYKEQKYYTLCMEYYLKSLTIEEELGNKIGKIKSYYNLGITNLELNKPNEALAWLTKGKKLAEELKDKKWIANLDEQLILTHQKLGNNTEAALLEKESIDINYEINKQEIKFELKKYETKIQLKKQEATFLQVEDYKKVCESIYKESLKLKNQIHKYSFINNFRLL